MHGEQRPPNDLEHVIAHGEHHIGIDLAARAGAELRREQVAVVELNEKHVHTQRG